MAAWITIYLRRSPGRLTTGQIQSGIAPADWRILGEGFGIEEDDVDRFMDGLVWNDEPLSFGQAEHRPVQIHTWADPARVEEELSELEDVPDAASERLAGTTAIVALELGISQLRTMHEAVGFEIAYWLAEAFQGLIRSPDDNWYDHDEFRWKPIP